MWFHENAGGDAPGKRGFHFSALNKSAIVLLCAAWESYIEFVVCEAADKNIKAAEKPDAILKSVQKLVSSHIREGKDESLWKLAAGNGWKKLAQDVVRSKANALNTPRLTQIDALMSNTLGVKDIGSNWSWHRSPLGSAAERLSEFVKLRGSIAHGEQFANFVKKSEVARGNLLLSRLVEKVEERLSAEKLL